MPLTKRENEEVDDRGLSQKARTGLNRRTWWGELEGFLHMSVESTRNNGGLHPYSATLFWL